MITQLVRRVERFTKKKQKNATKFVRKSIKKLSKRIQKFNKRNFQKVIANSLAIKMVGYAALFMVTTAGYQPALNETTVFASQLKFDKTKSIPVSMPEKSINIKVEPIIPPAAPVVEVKAEVRDTTARERAPKVATPVVKVIAPVAKVPDSEIKAYAKRRSDEMFGEGHWGALESLWMRESGWNYTSTNKSSGACGIPQANPCSKAGGDYRTNPYTQIEWGLKYIAARYKTPTGAWAHFTSKHWY